MSKDQEFWTAVFNIANYPVNMEGVNNDPEVDALILEARKALVKRYKAE
jgi:hypothetical protein